MSHENCLLELLRPLGVYDLGKNSINRGELGAYGRELDEALETIEHIAREMSLTTAQDTGLEQVEALLPYRPVGDGVQERRQALAALLRIGDGCFTRTLINDTLSGCGINARAAEGEQPGYVEVSFPDVAGIPEAFEELRAIIEEILPCHLEVTYLFWFNTWAILMERVSTWEQAESLNMTWYEMSVWKQ